MAWPPRFVRSSPLPIPRPWWGPGLFLAGLLMPLPAAAAGLAAPPPGLAWAGLMALVGLCALVLALASVVILLGVLGVRLAMITSSRQDIERVALTSRSDLRAEVAAVRAEVTQSQSDIRASIQGEFRALREEIRALDEAVNKILRMMGEK